MIITLKDFPQMSHTCLGKILSGMDPSCILILCWLTIVWVMALYGQNSHPKGLNPVCCVMWSLNCLLLESFLEHLEHWNQKRASCWWFRWRVSMLLLGNFWSQWSHLNTQYLSSSMSACSALKWCQRLNDDVQDLSETQPSTAQTNRPSAFFCHNGRVVGGGTPSHFVRWRSRWEAFLYL